MKKDLHLRLDLNTVMLLDELKEKYKLKSRNDVIYRSLLLFDLMDNLSYKGFKLGVELKDAQTPKSGSEK